MNPKQFSLYLLKFVGDKFVVYANNDVPDKSLDWQIVLVLIFFFFFFFFFVYFDAIFRFHFRWYTRWKAGCYYDIRGVVMRIMSTDV